MPPAILTAPRLPACQDHDFFSVPENERKYIDRSMNGLTGAELLKRYLANGAEDAFAALVERRLALVYGVALRHLQGTAPAQEVTQEVFITLARRAVWLPGQASLGGWLYRTTIHLAQNESRAEQRRRRREQIASANPAMMATTRRYHLLTN